MKKVLQILAVLLAFASCTPQNYYQLVETGYNDLSKTKEYLTFENDDIEILYDFWGDKGNGSFIIKNKLEKDIFVDLKRSHLIMNDFAFTYFQNRSYSTPKVSFFSSASDEELEKQRKIKFPGITPKELPEHGEDVVVFNEERVICIPSKSSQIVYGFTLQTEIYRDCNLLRFPKTKEILSSDFTLENTPLKYRNRISYGFSEQEPSEKQIENSFWVSKITNYSQKDFIGSEYLKYCNDSSSYRINTYPFRSNTSFYFKYKLEPGSLNH